MASLYMALADKTRLRLLNLMRDQEVCVGFFTEILGDSQPKISRHLAYLRNAGIVSARRDGKWIHYSICWPVDKAGQRVLSSVLEWIASTGQLEQDRQRYYDISSTTNGMKQIPHSPMHNIYEEAYINDGESVNQEDEPSHNELEDFLL